MGTVVTIATGRMFPSAKQFAQQLGINVPLITYQGAIIKDVDEKEVIYERLISPDIAQKLVEIACEKKYTYKCIKTIFSMQRQKMTS